jgi:hypothetical protein
MTLDQVLSLGPALAEFLGEFSDCLGRSEPRQHLSYYVRGNSVIRNARASSPSPCPQQHREHPRAASDKRFQIAVLLVKDKNAAARFKNGTRLNVLPPGVPRAKFVTVVRGKTK